MGNAIAVSSQEQWCNVCGNSTGSCSPQALGIGSSSGSSGSDSRTSSGSGGVSKVVAGVIGAMVTLAVILGLELLVMLIAGLRVVSKKSRSRSSGTGLVGNGEAVKA